MPRVWPRGPLWAACLLASLALLLSLFAAAEDVAEEAGNTPGAWALFFPEWSRANLFQNPFRTGGSSKRAFWNGFWNPVVEYLYKPSQDGTAMEPFDLLQNIFWLLLLLGAGRLLSYAVVAPLLRAAGGGTTDRASSSDNLWSIFFHSYVVYLCVHACVETSATKELRWGGVTESSTAAALLLCADNAVQLPVQAMKGHGMKKNLTVLAHHILQNAAMLLALHTGRCHFWGCLVSMSEGTNPPLSFVFILKECGKEGSQLFVAASVTCWLCFLVMRMLLYPIWLCAFFSDLWHNPDASWYALSNAEVMLYPLVVLAITYLSATWMVPLTRGTKKVWRGRKESRSPPKVE